MKYYYVITYLAGEDYGDIEVKVEKELFIDYVEAVGKLTSNGYYISEGFYYEDGYFSKGAIEAQIHKVKFVEVA